MVLGSQTTRIVLEMASGRGYSRDRSNQNSSYASRFFQNSNYDWLNKMDGNTSSSRDDTQSGVHQQIEGNSVFVPIPIVVVECLSEQKLAELQTQSGAQIQVKVKINICCAYISITFCFRLCVWVTVGQ